MNAAEEWRLIPRPTDNARNLLPTWFVTKDVRHFCTPEWMAWRDVITDQPGVTILHHAARYAPNVLEYMLRHYEGARALMRWLDSWDVAREPPLCWAVAAGEHAVRVLLDAGASSHCRKDSLFCPIAATLFPRRVDITLVMLAHQADGQGVSLRVAAMDHYGGCLWAAPRGRRLIFDCIDRGETRMVRCRMTLIVTLGLMRRRRQSHDREAYRHVLAPTLRDMVWRETRYESEWEEGGRERRTF